MYSRFTALTDFEEKDLEKLRNCKVAVVGLGATGSVIAEHLARHGINLLILDRDYLEENDVYSSNIYTPEDCQDSIPKAVAAEKYLEKFTGIDSRVASLNPENVDLLDGTDLIIDGTDNLETRFLINEFSKKEEIPWIYTAAIGEKGYSMFFKEKCFNCVFDDINAGSLETCEVAGVLRESSTAAASITSTKAVKHLTGQTVEETLDTVEGDSFQVVSSGCDVCRDGSYSRLGSSRKTVAVCGENKYQLDTDIGAEGREKIREQGKVLSDNKYVLRSNINGKEISVFSSGRIIVEANDKGHAESFVSETIGV